MEEKPSFIQNSYWNKFSFFVNIQSAEGMLLDTAKSFFDRILLVVFDKNLIVFMEWLYVSL